MFGSLFGKLFNWTAMMPYRLTILPVSVPSRLQLVTCRDAMLSSNNVLVLARKLQRTGRPINNSFMLLSRRWQDNYWSWEPSRPQTGKEMCMRLLTLRKRDHLRKNVPFFFEGDFDMFGLEWKKHSNAHEDNLLYKILQSEIYVTTIATPSP